MGDKQFALFGHVIKNLTTNGKMPCLVECLNTPQCYSINKHEDEAGKVTCELSKSNKEASPNDFKPRPGFDYLQTVVSLSEIHFQSEGGKYYFAKINIKRYYTVVSLGPGRL